MAARDSHEIGKISGLALFPLFVLALPARAHVGAAAPAPDLADAWSLDLALVVPLALATLWYAIGLAKYWRRAGAGRGVRVREATAYALAMLALFLATVWPLDALGEWSFAAHMAQHMMLAAVAAPLLLLGRPGVVCLAALPVKWVRPLTRPLKVARRRNLPAVIAGTTTAMLLQAAVMWGWHIPAAMELALRSELVHYAMHASFLGVGLLFWWALLRSLRERQAGFGAGALALVGTMLQMGFLSALLTFAPLARYPWYVDRVEAMGLTPLEDQQLAGLIMWVPGSLPYVIGILVLMAAWLRHAERYDQRRARSAR